MGRFKIGERVCNNCIHWKCDEGRASYDLRVFDGLMYPPTEVYTPVDRAECGKSRWVMNAADTCPCFEHAPEKLKPGLEFMKSINIINSRTSDSVSSHEDDVDELTDAEKAILEHHKKMEARKLARKRSLIERGLDEDASEQEVDEFEELFNRAAEGSAKDKYAFGKAFETGEHGATESKKMAFEWYKKAAEEGHGDAQYSVAEMLWYGRGIEEDENEAIKWYKAAAKSSNWDGWGLGPCDAKKRLVTIFSYQPKWKDYQEAFKWAEQLANDGYEEYINWMGRSYKIGRGCVADLGTACDWWFKNAKKRRDEDALKALEIEFENGYVRAAYLLGCAWYHSNSDSWSGPVIDADYPRAVKWFKVAADKGMVYAQCKLGDCYRLGRGGLAKSDEHALEWYRKAADNGDAIAEYWMAEFYEDGRGGLEKDMQTSFEWRLKSAKHGDSDAMNGVGWAYQQGRGTEKDATEAVKWYRKAIENGNRASMNNLAKCYEDGIGVEVNILEAFNLFKQSAEKGFSRGCYHLGRFYENGFGCDKDENVANKWYQKAADKGDKDAKAALERLGQG